MDKFKLELFFQILGIGATSGLVFENDSLFLISDSSSFLYEYNFSSERLDKIKLFENSRESILKKDKPDFESIVKKFLKSSIVVDIYWIYLFISLNILSKKILSSL